MCAFWKSDGQRGSFHFSAVLRKLSSNEEYDDLVQEGRELSEKNLRLFQGDTFGGIVTTATRERKLLVLGAKIASRL